MPRKQASTLSIALCALIVILGALPAWAAHHEGEKTVVHLSKFGNDLHAVSMALKLGIAMQQAGSSVTLFVDLEGVRLADQGQNLALRWGEGAPIEELYDGFIAAGGKVLVCPHCAAAAGIDGESLRNGATMGTTESITKILSEAVKILDY